MYFSKVKRWVLLALCFVLVSPIWAAAPLKVVVVSSDFASLVKRIGGDRVDVTVLVPGSRNLHHIDPKPSMIVAMRKADLLVRLGMSQDTWVDGLIQVARNPRLFKGKKGYLDPSAPIRKLEVPEGHIDGRHGDVHVEGNPHYWLDPMNGVVIAKQIRDRLSVLDPDSLNYYYENYQEFHDDIVDNIAEWKQRLEALGSTRFVTYHTVWSYFFDAFDLTVVGQLEPVPGVPPTPRHLMTLRDNLQDSGYPVTVLCASYYPKKQCRQFAQDIDGAVLIAAPNSDDDEDGYIDLFDKLIEELVP